MMIWKLLVTVWAVVLESVTRIVNENVPAMLGVPLIVPVEDPRVSPDGKLPDETAHL